MVLRFNGSNSFSQNWLVRWGLPKLYILYLVPISIDMGFRFFPIGTIEISLWLVSFRIATLDKEIEIR